MIQQSAPNIFRDVPSQILIAMLKEPSEKWSVRDFVKAGVSLGEASRTLKALQDMGYLRRVYGGRSSYSHWDDDVLKNLKEFKKEYEIRCASLFRGGIIFNA